MKSYDKTLWENNKTVVDADYLNNIENQVQILTLNAVQNNSSIQYIEDTLPMKSNINHTHDDINSNLEELITEFNTLKEELGTELSKYFNDVRLVDNILQFYNDNTLLKSLELPAVSSPKIRAICGEVLCGEVVSNQGLETIINNKAKSYNPTIWEDGVTPINAANLNNIETKIVELVTIVEEIVNNGGTVSGGNVYIGDTEPTDTNVLWVDNSDEQTELLLDNSAIEAFSQILREHSDNIKELFYLSDAYLDDGEFTDTEESDYILEGGIF